MEIERKAVVLAVLGAFVLSLAVTVLPVSAWKYGCTPGFWKQPQHVGFWMGYSRDQTVGSVFSYTQTGFPDLADDTLVQALNYEGGPGLGGAARILLRAAVATLLNSAYNAFLGGDTWEYAEWTPDAVVHRVNEVLSWGDRAAMLSVAQVFDDENNKGCPLGEQD